MKKLPIITAFGSSLLFASAGFAAHTFIPTPRSSYMAERPELPSPKNIDYNFTEGFYVAGRVGMTRANKTGSLSGITHGALVANKRHVAGGGVALGYMMKETGFLNRVEAEYYLRGRVGYKDATNTTNYSVESQTALLKAYSSINLGHQIFPYVFVGAGLASNQARVSTVLETIPVSGKSRRSKFSFAGAAGIGTRFRLNSQVMADVNYEFDYLGKTRSIPLYAAGSSTVAAKAQPNSLNLHTINVGFIIQPFNGGIER